MPLHDPKQYDCPECGGYGVDAFDPDCDCEECDGTGKVVDDEGSE